jgi:biopolymer transport protein ExbB
MSQARPIERTWIFALVAVGVLVALEGRGATLFADAEKTAAVSEQASGAPRPATAGVPTTNLWEIMLKGGPLMWPLALCSVVGLAFVFERFIALRPSRVVPKPFVTRFLQQVREGDLDRDGALAICNESPSPVAELFSGGVRKWGRPSVEVEQGLIDAGERAATGLRRYLRLFLALAVIGPLLGLLGTVVGMIQTFNGVAAGGMVGGAANQMADGISKALLNTAFGLIIAIPAQSFYYVFVSRVDRLIIEMDKLGQELVYLISAEELRDRKEGERKSAPRRPVRGETTV